MEKNKSPHILNTSSTLFGLCFVVLTSLKALKMDKDTLIDECTSLAMLFFMCSCLFSFLSIRSTTNRADHYEKVADYIFLGALIFLFVITISILFHLIH